MRECRPEVKMLRRWPLLVVLVLATACHSVAPAPTVPAAPAATPAPVAAAPRASESTRWVRDSAEHRAIFLQVYRQATAFVEQAAAGRAPGTWAVVLDADETVIDNSLYQLERAEAGKTYDRESWRAWIARRESTPLPGAGAFLERVRALGGKIVIVTNRNQSECPDTEAVFAAHRLAWDAMLCKPDGTPSDKASRFAAVAAGTTAAGLPPLEIVAFVGDNIQDFPHLTQAIQTQDDTAFTEFGAHYFVLPNPMYGSWN
jgi:5'-nucleotidase (lipoprotein e(P4) family)